MKYDEFDISSYSREELRMSSQRFINREVSWLQFNRRVLAETFNTAHPLLERVRFLSISAVNLDEFFMVRVAGLEAQVKRGESVRSPDGKTSAEQLNNILHEIDILQHEQQAVFSMLRKSLEKEGITVIRFEELTLEDRSWLAKVFEKSILPVLRPLLIDSVHYFPFIPNLALSMGIRLVGDSEDIPKIALLQLSKTLSRFIQLQNHESGTRYIPLEDVVSLFIGQLFPGYNVQDFGIFRIIRDSSDIEFEEEAENLVLFFKNALEQRRCGSIIRIEINPGMPEGLRQFFVKKLAVSDNYVSVSSGLLALNTLSEIACLPREDLKFKQYNARFPDCLGKHGRDCFASMREQDIIIHHPYESFDMVVQFLRQAAQDPDVLVIKQTLYRTSNDSPIVRALIVAAEAGKSVTALVELKARFNEEANIRCARDLERAGVKVVFGVFTLKIHAKMSMVVRREDKKLRTYCHFGTGNYHPVVAQVYTDLSFFTCDKSIAHDMTNIFNFIMSYSKPEEEMIVAFSPYTLRPRILKHIQDEIEYAHSGCLASIWMKLNSLVDPEIIDALYIASESGVKIDLVVRGICCLRPQVSGLSKNIRVKSIVGRFLEHSRIFVFGNGYGLPSEEAIAYIGSADMMPRNLDRRVEVLVPIRNPLVHRKVVSEIMFGNLLDNKQSYEISSEGMSRRLEVEEDEEAFSVQEYFMNNLGFSGMGDSLESKVPKLVAKFLRDRNRNTD
ncbi:LOW QUALITY PROTEIN: Polyphosphate kinase [Liberibacter crescens BT-1]|uniref:Polyphosphate kinase n=1 Tax=Liberibacter crescens (strain BT-1) TaxID=1215343 RepID=L0EWQ3_LIBCB|nr:LOW QUALITY PROTEIN: Polyphosphate kinase [Liberibacter crescens BT-1]